MVASEGSFIGIAPQTAKGTPNVTDLDFQYLLLTRSGLGENNVNLPMDMEVGGGAFLRDVVKTGITTGGPLQFIPRPDSIGHFFYAFFGSDLVSGASPDPVSHTFGWSVGDSQFTAPYYTLRSSPGGMHGMQYQDCILQALSLQFRGADFLRASAAFLGGLPAKVDTALWDPTSAIDNGPPFVNALSSVAMTNPSVSFKVLEGAITFANAIPLDQQWILGSYVPDDFAINQRSVNIGLRVKIDDDGALYRQIALDPADGASWVAEVLKSGTMIQFKTATEMVEGAPYHIYVTCSGNIAWTVAPLDIVPGRQLIMDITGTILANDAASPVSVQLQNFHYDNYDGTPAV